jgi:hypothetical integral membrane protein (TIGR02206 family)
MTNMDINYAIPFLSDEWILNNFFSLIYIIAFLLLGKYVNKDQKLLLAYSFVYVFIGIYIVYHVMHFIEGTWSLSKRLPFHLCGISSVLVCVIMFLKKRQLAFEFLFYCGILGGINALLTPLIDNYTGTNFFYIEYYYSHSSIIIFPLYLFYFMEMKLTKYSWLKSFLILNILLIFIMPLDFLLDANYMYLVDPPPINHPLVTGEWPYYLIYLEFFVFFLLFFTYSLFKLPFLKN